MSSETIDAPMGTPHPDASPEEVTGAEPPAPAKHEEPVVVPPYSGSGDDLSLALSAHPDPLLGEFDPEAPVPTVEEWADHVQRAVALIGADHVAIGLDLFQGRSHLKDWDASGYHLLAEALRKRHVPNSVLGENWMRVLDKAKVA